jgi:hypothetical protein
VTLVLVHGRAELDSSCERHLEVARLHLGDGPDEASQDQHTSDMITGAVLEVTLHLNEVHDVDRAGLRVE